MDEENTNIDEIEKGYADNTDTTEPPNEDDLLPKNPKKPQESDVEND